MVRVENEFNKNKNTLVDVPSALNLTSYSKDSKQIKLNQIISCKIFHKNMRLHSYYHQVLKIILY